MPLKYYLYFLYFTGKESQSPDKQHNSSPSHLWFCVFLCERSSDNLKIRQNIPVALLKLASFIWNYCNLLKAWKIWKSANFAWMASSHRFLSPFRRASFTCYKLNFEMFEIFTNKNALCYSYVCLDLYVFRHRSVCIYFQNLDLGCSSSERER